jgi:hypothetical protein
LCTSILQIDGAIHFTRQVFQQGSSTSPATLGLRSEIEIAFLFMNGYKGYYIRVGEFTGPRFTVADQLKRNSYITRSKCIPRGKALAFLQDLASISTPVFSLSLLNSQSNNANDGTAVDIDTSDTIPDQDFTSDTIVDNSITSNTSVDCHFKTLLQVYFLNMS